MLWADRESNLPVIILDECIYSPELQHRLCNIGYNTLFLGSGLPDSAIRSYMQSNADTVLITADNEFDSWFSWKQCMLVQQTTPLHELVKITDEFMWQFKEDAKK
jgi:hypothetical protein